MEYSAQRVRSKVRTAVHRREDAIEQDEMESGELNLIPYLDMVTNLMLFLLFSVSAGIVLTQIDTTLPDKKKDGAAPAKPDVPPDDQPLKLFVSVEPTQMTLWSISGLEGTLGNPKDTFKRTGQVGAPCEGGWMCETNKCMSAGGAGTGKCEAGDAAPAPVFEYRRLNDALFEIANRRYAKRPRKPDTYQIVLQADPSIPYATIVSIMSVMRCKLPDVGKESLACALPTDDPELKKSPEPVSPDGRLYDTTRAVYDPTKMALFHEIGFSSGFE